MSETGAITPFAEGDFVVVRPEVSESFGGRVGTVVTVERRQRGPKTTRTKYDYGLRFGASGIIRFEHAELRAASPGETRT